MDSKTMDNSSKFDILALEILSKSCPRCGGKSANSSNPSGRCRSCLNKLARAKKTPGHWQRSQTKADDALRRQKGKAGGHPTAKGTSRGNGTRKEIVNKIKRAEKKTGQKLSPDRKDNGKGYSSSNVRAIPEHLNRGRHNADEKKLKEWRKRLKKSEDKLNDISLNLMNHFEGSLTSPSEHHYSVNRDGQEIGRAIVFDKDPRSIHEAGKTGPSLKDIRLHPSYQGQGLSGQIINKLIDTHGPLASDSRGNISEAGAKMFEKYGEKQKDGSYILKN